MSISDCHPTTPVSIQFVCLTWDKKVEICTMFSGDKAFSPAHLAPKVTCKLLQFAPCRTLQGRSGPRSAVGGEFFAGCRLGCQNIQIKETVGGDGKSHESHSTTTTTCLSKSNKNVCRRAKCGPVRCMTGCRHSEDGTKEEGCGLNAGDNTSGSEADKCKPNDLG